jgi:drug/metabolite transporter (DMT)-like permease
VKALVRLYPRAWRNRYQDEFLAVLEVRPIGPFDAVDIVLGAMDARRRAIRGPGRTSQRKEIRMSTRLGGLAALATGLLWFALLAVIAMGDDIELLGVVTFLLGMVALVLAVIGLGAAQGRAHPVATWTAVAVPVVGVVVAIFGFLVLNFIYGDVPVIGDLTPWAIGTLGIVATLIGAVLFGLVTLMSRVLSPSAAALIAVGGVGVLVLASFGSGGLVVLPEILMQILLVSAVVAFGVGWLWLGRTAIQAAPRTA